MFETIVIPLDGSKLAEAILTQIRKILLRQDARLVLVHALTIPAGTEMTTPELIEADRTQGAWYLKEMSRKLEEQGVRVKTVLRTGHPADVILDVAAEERATLIAMTTHGRTGLPRWAFGSVAEKVVRASPIPVLVIRSFSPAGSAVSSEALTLKRILLPLSDAELSLAAVDPALEVAELFGSSVSILHVCEGAACTMPVPQITAAYERFHAAGLAVEPLMRQGDPAVQVLEASKDLKADLIVMTTHGRKGLSRWMMGSVAEKILRASDVPMLIVRPAAPKSSTKAKGRARTGSKSR